MGQDGIVSKLIIKLGDSIRNICEKVENVKGKKIELVIVLVYLILHFFLMFFHEPWFDEAVAWLIAKDSSLYDLLFVAPHYEGHPSLWHIILAPFAKLGAPYELSLSLISLAFSGAAVILFVYKAPFKRIFRILIPFSYFVFYQYSVVSRPYCMMMLAFVLVAITYSDRDTQPGRFILSLWFLCITSAYGLVISGGICIVWLVEMLKKTQEKSSNKNSDNGETRGLIRIFFEDYLLKKGIIIWLLGLLAYALFIVWRIIPEADTYANLKKYDYEFVDVVKSVSYSLLGSVSDIFVTNTFSREGTLLYASVNTYELCISCAIGLCIYIFIYRLARKKHMVIEFFFPLIMFVAFMSVYAARHHIGIIILFIGYWSWIYSKRTGLYENDKPEAKVSHGKNNGKIQLSSGESENSGIDRKKMLSSVGIILVTMIFAVNIYWSISSSVLDINRDYSYGHQEYEFLEQNGLLNSPVLADWEYMKEIDEGTPAITFSCRAVNIQPYLQTDIIMNSMYELGSSYTYLHKVPTGEKTDGLIKKIQNTGKPVVLLGTAPLMNIYESKYLNFTDYSCVYKHECGTIWKGVPEMIEDRIYVLNEYADEHGLTKLPK